MFASGMNTLPEVLQSWGERERYGKTEGRTYRANFGGRGAAAEPVEGAAAYGVG